MQWFASRYTAVEKVNGTDVLFTVSYGQRGKWRGQATALSEVWTGGVVIASCTRPELGQCRGEIERLAREKLK